jgi:hypothetical protein
MARRVKKSAHASEQEQPDILKRRQAWFDGHFDLDPERLVFMDETWAKTDIARTDDRGRSPDEGCGSADIEGPMNRGKSG